jgi:hypothetical protein
MGVRMAFPAFWAYFDSLSDYNFVAIWKEFFFFSI